MAATYSAFMSTRFYSPVFNTALFDGPIRIYFSQSYEASSLKIYHLLHHQYAELMKQLKAYSVKTKQHVFLVIYPEQKDLEIVFEPTSKKTIYTEKWQEGLTIACAQANSDEEFNNQINEIISTLKNWIGVNSLNEISH